MWEHHTAALVALWGVIPLFFPHLLPCLCKSCENKIFKKRQLQKKTFRQAINILSQFAFQCKTRSNSHLIDCKHFTLKMCLSSVDLTQWLLYSVNRSKCPYAKTILQSSSQVHRLETHAGCGVMGVAL